MSEFQDAPGRPGLAPTWSSSAKTGVGTALSALSRVSFTLSHGILNEIYYPRIDEACTRDCGLIITDGAGYLSEEKRDTVGTVEQIADGVPGYRLRNTSRDGRYTIEKRVVSDPSRDVVLQHIRLISDAPLRAFMLLAPHLVNAGAHNTAYVDVLKGWRMPFASGRGVTLAMAASRPFKALSVGFVGVSDGFTLLHRSFTLEHPYVRAEDGNVALCAELDLLPNGEPIVVAIGFGRDKEDAGNRARASIMDGYATAERAYATGWMNWQSALVRLDGEPAAHRDQATAGSRINLYRVSTAVLRCHEAMAFAAA